MSKNSLNDFSDFSLTDAINALPPHTPGQINDITQENPNTYPYVKTEISQWRTLNEVSQPQEKLLEASFPIAMIGAHDQLIASSNIDPGAVAKNMHNHIIKNTDRSSKWCLIITVETQLGTQLETQLGQTDDTRVNHIVGISPETTAKLLHYNQTIKPSQLTHKFMLHAPNIVLNPVYNNGEIQLNNLNNQTDVLALVTVVETYHRLNNKTADKNIPLYTTADYFTSYQTALAYLKPTPQQHPIIVNAQITGILPYNLTTSIRTWLNKSANMV